jgi:cephalosporin-C deacetylase-like acetyl esterase
MTEILVRIKNRRKVSFIKELLRSFSYVELKDFEKEFTPAEKKVLKGLKQSFKEVKLAEQGKIKLKTLQQLLDEL